MFDIKLKYESVIFVNSGYLKATPENIGVLLNIFGDKGLIPTTFQELGGIGLQPETRIQLLSTDGQWVLMFASDRINIIKNQIDIDKDRLGSLYEFCENSGVFFERISNSFKVKANRISLVPSYMAQEMTNDNMDNIYCKLFQPPNFYQKNLPFEWNWRSVAKTPFEFAGLHDQVNVITMINRIQGQINATATPFDRLQLTLDINTDQENTDYRFGARHVFGFYNNTVGFHDQLFQEMEAFIK